MAQKSPPPFVAKIQRFLAVEFLTIVIIGLLCVILFIIKIDTMTNPSFIFNMGAALYGIIFFIKIVISSIKIVFYPNSSK